MIEPINIKGKPQNRWVYAVLELAPNSGFNSAAITDSLNREIIEWLTPDIPQPSEEDIQAKIDEFEAEWTATEYARNRQSEYPIMGDQMDMMYKDTKNSTTTHADAVEAVKTKWPKDNTGPVE